MIQKDSKWYIYWIIDMYLSKKISAVTFCNEFHDSYDIELDYDQLTTLEHKLFLELGTIAGRFSEFEEDHKKYPGTYFTEKQLKDKIIETKEKLRKPDLKSKL